MESDSDNDEDTQMQELLQLTEVIRADNALLSESSHCSTGVISMDAPTSSLSVARDKLSKLDTALALNKLMYEKFGRLEDLLKNRLSECQKRLEQFKDSPTEKLETEPKFRYVNCGKPYFRDPQNFPAPDNEDTILMRKTGMYDLSMVSSVPGWTLKDKSQFLKVLLELSREHKAKELQSKMAQLKRYIRGAKSKSKKLEKTTAVHELKKEIEAIKKKSLNEIAMGIEEEYDWDFIAIKLKGRHSAQEYQSLWKLFLHPSINKSPWTKEEHVTLQRLAAEHNYQDWDAIARDLNTGRTGYHCFIYFRTNTASTVTGQKWTTEEEDYLKRLIEYYRTSNYIPWGKIAATMDNRTKVQIYNKYATLIVKRKGRYLPEEDAVILACVKKYGKNYAKIAEHLPGRSAKQIQVRHSLLNKPLTVSVVWTAEEDRKLVEIVSNSDTAVNYSNITALFPGKNRYNLRARYITLEKWMKRHPFEDIGRAPRRGSRRLKHGQENLNIKLAVDKLKLRLKAEVDTMKKNEITEDSSEKDIEDTILSVLANEANQKKERQVLEDDAVDERPVRSHGPLDELNLHQVLLLLRAKFNKGNFKNNVYAEKYPGLLSTKLANSSVRSYSKKAVPECVNVPDIWGNTLPKPRFHLPPNYETVSGCRTIMKNVMGMTAKPSLALMEKHNAKIREQKQLLAERFSTLFLWPMMLATQSPMTRVAPQCTTSVPRPKKPNSMNHKHVPTAWVKPMYQEMDETNNHIDLQETVAEEDINISASHVGNDDFMYLPIEDKNTVEDPVVTDMD